MNKSKYRIWLFLFFMGSLLVACKEGKDYFSDSKLNFRTPYEHQKYCSSLSNKYNKEYIYLTGHVQDSYLVNLKANKEKCASSSKNCAHPMNGFFVITLTDSNLNTNAILKIKTPDEPQKNLELKSPYLEKGKKYAFCARLEYFPEGAKIMTYRIDFLDTLKLIDKEKS